MHKKVMVVLVFVISVYSLYAGEVSKKVKDQAMSLYEETAKTVFSSEITQIKPRIVSSKLGEFCKPYKFFLVGIPVPERMRTSMTPAVIFYKIVSADKVFPVNGAKEIAVFLTEFKKPVSEEEDVMVLVSIFAEMLNAKIRTDMPEKKSIIKKYMDQKPENWKFVISKTESGWKSFVTLMIHSDIEYCIRYALEFSREGKISVLNENDIYSYTLYE